MNDLPADLGAAAAGSAIMNSTDCLDAALKAVYRFECFDAEGNLKWAEEAENLLATVGANDLLTQYFKGSAYTAAYYVGLKGTGTFAATDTMASHSGWSEVNPYSGARPTPTWGTASAGSLASTAIAFAITASATVAGAFLTTNSTAGGTTGTLYSAADFAASRSVLSGDTLNVTITVTAA